MSVKISIGIPHCGWRADRRASMAVLRTALNVPREEQLVTEARRSLDRCRFAVFGPIGWQIAYHEQCDERPTPVWDWSSRIWARIASVEDATHAMLLQDDTRVFRGFWSAVHAIMSVARGEVIAWHLRHPYARAAAAAGERFVTGFGCAGVGWTMPMPRFRDFLAWQEKLSIEQAQSITEDSLMDAWLAVRRRRCWSPVPTIVAHDTTHESTFDDTADHHMRDTVLDWERFPDHNLCDPMWWRAGLPPGGPRHLCFAGVARPGASRSGYPAGFDGHALR